MMLLCLQSSIESAGAAQDKEECDWGLCYIALFLFPPVFVDGPIARAVNIGIDDVDTDATNPNVVGPD